MNFDEICEKIVEEQGGVEISTMMGSKCLRYEGNFMTMFFKKMDGLIIKVAEERVNALILSGSGLPFDFTTKTFKEWVLIPIEYEDEYESFILEALDFARPKA